jgi:outer membrane biosynthesis protein TonB
MGSENEKAGDSGKKRDSYDAAVLGFLDKEIESSSKPMSERAAQAEDVEALVNDLLKESIRASNPVEVEKDAELEDLDRLFSHIFHEQKPTSPPAIIQVQPEPDSGLDQAFQEIAVEAGEAANPGSVEAVSATAAAETAAAEPPIPHEQISSAMVPEPTALEATQHQLNPEPEDVPAQTQEPHLNPIFSITKPARPTFRLQMALVGGAFVCILAATGVVYFIGSRNSAPDKSGLPPAVTVPATPSKSEKVAASASATMPTMELKETPGTAVRNAADANPAGDANHNKVKDGSESRKEGKPATAAPVTSTKPNSNTTVPLSTAANDRGTAPAVVPPAENAPAPPPARSAEVTAPPAGQVQAPESALASLIPKPAANLGDVAILNRPAIQPSSPEPPLPNKAIAATVISRVLPSYPEIARINHIAGTVVVDVLIDEKGKVVKATPVSGPAVLYGETVNAVLRWKFQPASLNDTAIPSSSQVSIIFK